MCLKIKPPAVIYELLVALLSLLIVVTALYNLVLHMKIPSQNTARDHYIRSDSEDSNVFKPTNISIVSGTDRKHPPTTNGSRQMMLYYKPDYNTQLQFDLKYGQGKYAEDQAREYVSMAIPGTIIAEIIASPPSIPNNSNNTPSISTSTIVSRIDMAVILLSMIVWIGGIFFNKFSVALADRLISVINKSSK